MQDERLSALDTAFLCLESAQAPMHLGALAVFEPERPIAPERLVEVLCDRISRLPVLRQRVRPAWLPPGSAVWEEDGYFRLERHLRVHHLDATADDPDAQDTLAALAGELMAEPLDLCRPLWQLHLVTVLPDSRFAVVVKLHHDSQFAGHNIGRFRLSLTTAEKPDLSGSGVPADVAAALQAAADQRSAQQNELLDAHFRKIAPELASIREQIAQLEAERTKRVDSSATAMSRLRRRRLRHWIVAAGTRPSARRAS